MLLKNLLAGAVAGVFFTTYFLKMYLLLRQGIKGMVLGKGSKNEKALWVERLLLPVSYICAATIIINVLFEKQVERIIPGFYSSIAVQSLGLANSLAGTVFFIAAVIEMKESWRAGIDEDNKAGLKTGGVYSISRNPAFVGFFLLYIGMALTFTNIISIAAAAAIVCTLHMQVIEEEKHLKVVFGESYTEYCLKVPRYLHLSVKNLLVKKIKKS